MLNITLVGDQTVMARLDAMPRTIQQILRPVMQGLAQDLKTHIQRDKLSGQVLNVVTGALRRSITALPLRETAESIVAEVVSSGDVKYAGINEFGGQTRPHDIYPKNAEALSFMIGGQQIFAKVVHHPGSKIPERSFMRSALTDMAPAIAERIQTAVTRGLAEAA